MLQIEAAQTGWHRGLAVGRSPGCAQPAVRPRPEAQRALALFLKDELVVDEAALAAAPFGRLVLVDAGPDGVDGVEVAAARILDGEENLPAVRVEPVPSLATAPAAARGRCRGGARRRRSSGCGRRGTQRSAGMSELVRQAELGARPLSPSGLAN